MWALIGMAVAGTALSAYSQYRSGKEQKEAYDYNAALELHKAAYEERKSRRETRQLLGRQKALYAKAGVDIASGSPLLSLIDTVEQGEEEAQMIRQRGISAYDINKRYGEEAETAGKVGAISSFLTGVGVAGTQYMSHSRSQSSPTTGTTKYKNPFTGRVTSR